MISGGKVGHFSVVSLSSLMHQLLIHTHVEKPDRLILEQKVSSLEGHQQLIA